MKSAGAGARVARTCAAGSLPPARPRPQFPAPGPRLPPPADAPGAGRPPASARPSLGGVPRPLPAGGARGGARREREAGPAAPPPRRVGELGLLVCLLVVFSSSQLSLCSKAGQCGQTRCPERTFPRVKTSVRSARCKLPPRRPENCVPASVGNGEGWRRVLGVPVWSLRPDWKGPRSVQGCVHA